MFFDNSAVEQSTAVRKAKITENVDLKYFSPLGKQSGKSNLFYCFKLKNPLKKMFFALYYVDMKSKLKKGDFAADDSN